MCVISLIEVMIIRCQLPKSIYLVTGRVLPHNLEYVGHSLIEQHLKQLADKPYNINVDHQQKKRQDEERSGSFQPHLFFLTSSYKTSFLPLYLSLLFLKKDEKVEKPGDDIFVSLDKKVFISWNISIFNFTLIPN